MKLITFIAVLCLLFSVISYAADKPSNTPETGRIAVVETNKGTIKIALYEKDAPITTKNFIDLANSKFYDGLKFHRVVEDFVIQGGDPKGDGTGGSDKTIKLEVSPKLKHDSAGVVAMARTSDPDSASSQFYITLAPTPFLDMQYAVFGKVIQGLDVVKKIEVGDVMKTVRIVNPLVTKVKK
jgi:cyclophilin family peptidyl-prolyl cis-trans isomerase